MRFNLSNDNMPDLGQAGLYLRGGWPPSQQDAPAELSVRSIELEAP